MSDFEQDPEAAVAALVARLPERFADLTFADLRALTDASDSIARVMRESTDAEAALLERIAPRATSPDQTVGDVATDAEVAEFDGLSRRYLGAERARAALSAWQERSGATEYGAAYHDHEPLLSEDPDGTIRVRVDADA